jgi:hypothetical protein
VVGVALRGVIGVFLLAKKGILGRAGSEAAARGIENGDANAEGSEVYAGYDAHKENLKNLISHR